MDSLAVEKKDGDKLPYIACELFCTERVKFNRVSSAQQEIDCYKAIYAESKNRNFWFSGVEPMCMFDKSLLDDEAIASIIKDYGSDAIFSTDHDIIQKKDTEYFQKKEQSGFYKLSMSFADYILLDKGSNELVGRFIFKDSVEEGRIEYGIYIFEKFRKNGLGVEIISGIFKSVVDPAVGQPFVISCFYDCDDVHSQQSPFVTTVYDNFQGVFGKAAPWYNYPSVSVSYKSGCALRWKDHVPITFYPQGNESCLAQSEVGCFNQVIKTLFMFNEISKLQQELKEEMPTIQPKQFFSVFDYGEESSIEEDPFKDEILEGLYGLLHTKDYNTLISTIEALIYIGESKEDLREELAPEEVSNLLSKNKSYLSGKHKELLEYLAKEMAEESSSESSELTSSQSRDGEITQKSKKKHLSGSDEEDAFRLSKRKKQTK